MASTVIPPYLNEFAWLSGLEGSEEIWIPLGTGQLKGLRVSKLKAEERQGGKLFDSVSWVVQVNTGSLWWDITSPFTEHADALAQLRSVVQTLQKAPTEGPLAEFENLKFEEPVVQADAGVEAEEWVRKFNDKVPVPIEDFEM